MSDLCRYRSCHVLRYAIITLDTIRGSDIDCMDMRDRELATLEWTRGDRRPWFVGFLRMHLSGLCPVGRMPRQVTTREGARSPTQSVCRSWDGPAMLRPKTKPAKNQFQSILSLARNGSDL